ncbi:Por secretion system C-terminal sorting domain-containing protein [Mesonia phycicola]|uniref:Por secretion system C-terminal sorting domain-containing protein n=1 Tax=Mesonia phycicola TaxID=579105 RepID=A0A1M6FIY1_9FLAO|nr:T9SS type A sorting domain-containing protein [Mesonia phycicola]SHI97698.1 Por secretion system C-terminal sorting domain-containing protein [Mesonia phycicola]
MKKLYFVACLFLSFFTNAQIQLTENFDQSAFPSNWTYSGSYGVSSNFACQNNSASSNLNLQSQNSSITSPNIEKLSTGTIVNIQFDYKILENSTSGVVNTATASGWGNMEVLYSLDQGVTWSSLHIIDNTNYSASTSCTTVLLSIPSTSIPIGSDFQLRFETNWLQGDYFFYLDNIAIDQVVTSIPNCDANVTSPLNTSVDISVNEDIQWQHATGGAVGYKITMGDTSGGNNIANNTVVNGGITVFDPGTLNELTTYYFTIVPYNSLGDAVGCTEYSFTTEEVCDIPSNISFTGITPYEANVVWLENGTATEWEVLYGDAGFDVSTQGTAVIDNDGVSDLIINNLQPNTSYDVYVRSICDVNNFSEWSVIESFSTLSLPTNDACSNSISIANFPYTTSQDATWATNNDGFITVCPGFGMNDGVWYTFAGTGYDITVTVEETSIWDSEIAIYSGDCSNLSCVDSQDLAADIQEITFTSTLGDIYYVNIGYYSGAINNSEGVFNLSVVAEDAPPCISPSNIVFNQVDSTSIEVIWQENNSATEWELVYGLQGFDINGANAITIIDNDGVSDEILTNLIADEDYEVYIKSICDDITTSEYLGPISFNSTLSVVSQNFETFSFYPNPFNSEITLESQKNISKVEIYSIEGKKIFQKNVNTLFSNINLSNYASGIYLMKVYIENNSNVFKLIKD